MVAIENYLPGNNHISHLWEGSYHGAKVSKAPPHAKPIFTCESHKDEVGRSDEEFPGDKLELLGIAFLATLRQTNIAMASEDGALPTEHGGYSSQLS